MSRLVINENDRSVVHEILEDEITVGRREGATIRLADTEAGDEHCQIRAVPGLGYKLIDLESRSGTKVNGAYVNQQLLKDGDVIEIGKARISFALEGAGPPSVKPPPPGTGVTAATAAAPPPIPAVATTTAAAGPVATARRPATGVARGPARGVVRQPDRDARPRRRTKKESNAPIIALGVMVGMMIFAVVMIWGTSAWFDESGNKGVFIEMSKLNKAGRYDEAIGHSKLADPNGDRQYYGKVQLELEYARQMREGRAGVGDADLAFKAYSRIESWVQDNRHDISGQIAKWEEFVRAHDGTHWASKARQNINRLLGGGGSVNAPSGSSGPTGNAKIDRNFRVAIAQAKSLADSDRFQEAIDAISDFWDENELRAANRSDWVGKIETAKSDLANQAESRYQTLHRRAQEAIDRGEYDSAIKIYRNIAEKFGIEKYQLQANVAIRKLHKEGDD